MRRNLKSLYFVGAFLLGSALFAQITGTVNDGSGFPESDVEVTVKGTDKVAYTDVDGNFEIDANVGDTLVINGKEVKVTSANLGVIKAASASETIELGTVSILGGIQLDPAQKIGSFETIKREDFENTPVASVDEVLNGRVAGLNFSTNSGHPGSTNIITIRGISSLIGNPNPLYVIDGVVVGKGSQNGDIMESFNPLSSIDPNQIENVTVLKDASATALYGARGANGVIVVTTKRGKFNQPTRFNLSSEFSVQNVAYDKAEFMNASEFVQWGEMILYNTGDYATRQEAREDFISSTGWDGVTNTDWRKVAQRNQATVRTYNFSVSGGGENTSFRTGFSYYDNNPLTLESKFDRLSGSLAVDHKASDKFKMGANINFSQVANRTTSDGGAFSNPWLLQWTAAPVIPVYNADGSYNMNLLGAGEFNPIAIQKTNYAKGDISTFLASVNGEYKFTDYLVLTSNWGGQYQQLKEKEWWNPEFGDGVNYGGMLQETNNAFFDWNWVNTLGFRKVFAEKHDVQVYAGIEYQEHKANRRYLQGRQFSALATPDMTNATVLADKIGYDVKWNQISYFGRVNYVFDNQLTIAGQLRRDANSTLSAGNKDGVFWSVGGSYNFAKIINSTDVNNLTFRANYGELGNIPYADSWWSTYNALPLMGAAPNYGTSGALTITNAGNDKLKWEVSKQLNIGVDFAFANNLISGTIDVYDKKTEDAIMSTLISYDTPSTDNTIFQNLGEIKNRGIEATLTVRPFRGDFNWSLTGNFSYNKNEVGKLLDPDKVYLESSRRAIQSGRILGEYYTYGWAGVDPSNGNPLWYTDETKTQTTSNINEADKFFQGTSAFPVYMGGLRSDMSWKNISLSVFFTGQFDYSVFDSWTGYTMNDGSYWTYNVHKELLYDSWSPENPNASNPLQIYGNASNSRTGSTRTIYKGDHIRLKEIKLGYSFGDKLKDSGIENLTVYLRGTNLVTWVFDKDLKFDPESNSNASAYAWANKGVYDYTSPIMKSISLGVSIDF